MTNEYRAPASSAEIKSRYIGLVVIPGHVIVKIEREVEEERDGRRSQVALGMGRRWC